MRLSHRYHMDIGLHLARSYETKGHRKGYEALHMDHLAALELRLSNERIRLSQARTEGEKALRKVWIAQIEREITNERKFIGIDVEMSDDELLKALGE